MGVSLADVPLAFNRCFGNGNYPGRCGHPVRASASRSEQTQHLHFHVQCPTCGSARSIAIDEAAFVGLAREPAAKKMGDTLRLLLGLRPPSKGEAKRMAGTKECRSCGAPPDGLAACTYCGRERRANSRRSFLASQGTRVP